jgi:hypothetical protein
LCGGRTTTGYLGVLGDLRLLPRQGQRLAQAAEPVHEALVQRLGPRPHASLRDGVDLVEGLAPPGSHLAHEVFVEGHVLVRIFSRSSGVHGRYSVNIDALRPLARISFVTPILS